MLLDVGAVWCHWCHVMDRESYEDPDLAAYLNAHFVCIKVDRDERPDVDARYQRAVQALTGQGGWPLTAFLTPDGDVFHGGTYFPPDGRHGHESFRGVLEKVRGAYRDQREKVDGSAREVRAHVAAALSEAAAGAPVPALLEQAADGMARHYDIRYGGFGGAPKFPHPGAIDFLLARWWDAGRSWQREVVEKTLAGMADGGVHDQLGGGFHRYSVDERWLVPHFEKMSYDNAALLAAYVHAFAALGVPRLRDVANGIVTWCLDVLAVPGGSFGASQDADVGLDDDGDYFTWTEAEARAALSEEEWAAARRFWDIYPEGEMHHDPRRNVLWVARGERAIAAELQLAEPAVTRLLASARVKLKAARDLRPAPGVDAAVYTGWNAMLAEALLEASAVLARPEAAAAALGALERLWTAALDDDGLMRHRADSPPDADERQARLLDDQAQAAAAALTAYEHTGRTEWLSRARGLIERTVARFEDPSDGAFLDAVGAEGPGLLAQAAKPIQDSPTPAANAVMALALLRLAAIAEEQRYAATAERALRAFAGSARELGLFGATYFRALDFLLNGACRIVVVEATTDDPSLLRTALSSYRPRRVVVHAAASPVPGVDPPVCLVCAGTVCAPPVREPAALARTLETFGRAG